MSFYSNLEERCRVSEETNAHHQRQELATDYLDDFPEVEIHPDILTSVELAAYVLGVQDVYNCDAIRGSARGKLYYRAGRFAARQALRVMNEVAA